MPRRRSDVDGRDGRRDGRRGDQTLPKIRSTGLFRKTGRRSGSLSQSGDDQTLGRRRRQTIQTLPEG